MGSRKRMSSVFAVREGLGGPPPRRDSRGSRMDLPTKALAPVPGLRAKGDPATGPQPYSDKSGVGPDARTRDYRAVAPREDESRRWPTLAEFFSPRVDEVGEFPWTKFYRDPGGKGTPPARGTHADPPDKRSFTTGKDLGTEDEGTALSSDEQKALGRALLMFKDGGGGDESERIRMADAIASKLGIKLKAKP